MDTASNDVPEGQWGEPVSLTALPEQVLVHIAEYAAKLGPRNVRHLRLVCRTTKVAADLVAPALRAVGEDDGTGLGVRADFTVKHPRLKALTVGLSDAFARTAHEMLVHLTGLQLRNLRSLSSLLLSLPDESSSGSCTCASALRSSSSGSGIALGEGSGSPSTTASADQPTFLDRTTIEAFFDSLPPSLTALYLDHFILPPGARRCTLDLPALHHALHHLPSLRALHLLGGIWLASERDIAALARLTSVVSLRDVRLGCGGVSRLVSLQQLARLELRLECSADFDGAHIPSTSQQLLTTLTQLTALTRLGLWEYQAETLPLLDKLAHLPHLAHLSLCSLDDYYLADAHLEVLGRYPCLTHLGVDRLDLQGETLCLPKLRSLDVNLTVLSYPRMCTVFPSVSRLQLRYLWEAAMRKIAGWQSLRSLYLGNLAFCIDWGLLRTLTNLERLHLARGSSYEQLCELLYLTRSLPHLSTLVLRGWQCCRPMHSGPSHLGGSGSGGNGGGFGGASSSSFSGSVLQQRMYGSDRDARPYSLSLMAATLDAELYEAVSGMRAQPSRAPVLALDMLCGLTALRSLEVSDCSNSLVCGLRGIRPLTGLRRLTLSKYMDLVPSDVAAMVANMPGLRELRLLACWPVTGTALLQQPEIAARRGSIGILTHAPGSGCSLGAGAGGSHSWAWDDEPAGMSWWEEAGGYTDDL